MSKDIKQLEPRAIWENFYELTQVPRPSNHEEKIQAYMLQFGEKLGLETSKDAIGNIIIRKPATAGYEDRKGVILQAHLDMVPQKNSDKAHNFETDPIEALVDGEWVTANGTTLGADNGIGAAAAMAILASNDIEHGPIEALFTATEETGMDGANGLEPGLLNGDILLNMDSEDEGELYVGCAGGEDISIDYKYRDRPMPKEYKGGKLSITGLKGGHSGMDIVLQRANANKIFFRILDAAYKQMGVRLGNIDGGSLRNAIPREAFGSVGVRETRWDKTVVLIEKLAKEICKEYAATEPNMQINFEADDDVELIVRRGSQEKITAAILACPNGVIRMSDSMHGLVETSVNLAVVKSNSDTRRISLQFLMRSSVDSAKTYLGARIASAFNLAKAEVAFSGAYPGWQPNMESPILKTMQEVYEAKYGKKPAIKAVHAGLECGILGGTYPNWDMISFGPTIRFPHSPDEKVDIASVAKFWDFLLEVLKNIPVK